MSQPAHKIRIGVLQVTIWRNHGEKGNWYSVIPSRSYKQGDDDLEGDRQPRLRRPADDGQAVRPGPHLDHAPAAGRRQGPQGIRSHSRLSHHTSTGRAIQCPPINLKGTDHDIRNHHHQSLLRRPPQTAGSHPAQAEPSRAGLRQAAAGTDQRQPGAAPDQPVPLPPGRRVRRPQLSRQLRRQPHQGLAATISSRNLCCDPMSGLGHLPRRLRRTRHPLHGLGHPSGFRRLRPARISGSGDVRLHLGSPALLAAEALCRRSPRPVARPTLEHFLRTLRPVHPQLRRCPQTRRQAGHPDGRLLRPRGRVRPAHVYHTKRLAFAAGLAQHCTDIIRFSHGASSSKKVYRSSFIPGLHDVCMIFEKAN